MDRNIVSSGYLRPPEKIEDYRVGARTLMRVINLQALIIFVLTLVLVVYLNTRQNQDRYIAETADNKVMGMSRLSLPNMGRTALSDWVANA